MSISILFSVAIFRILSGELDRGYQRLHRRLEGRILPGQIPPPFLDPQELNESKEAIKRTLIYINLLILGISATAGYFLAGKTLKPIKAMVDEQNQFISDASHELRTPLTALRTELEVGLRDKDLDLRGAKKILVDNLEEVESLQNLSENLLVLAKDQNYNGVYFQAVSLKEIVSMAVSKVEILAKKKKITINQKVVARKFKADEDKLVRLVVILLDNAVKYSPNGSLINVEAKQIDYQIRILVEDHGIGISKEDLPKIFDRFYRVDKARSKTEGFGLGLSIARKIVQQHKGTIGVESEEGKGSIFTVLLDGD